MASRTGPNGTGQWKAKQVVCWSITTAWSRVCMQSMSLTMLALCVTTGLPCWCEALRVWTRRAVLCRRWPKVYDLCQTFCTLLESKSPRPCENSTQIAWDLRAILAWPTKSDTLGHCLVLCAGTCSWFTLQEAAWSSGPFFSQVHGLLPFIIYLWIWSNSQMETNGLNGLNRIEQYL